MPSPSTAADRHLAVDLDPCGFESACRRHRPRPASLARTREVNERGIVERRVAQTLEEKGEQTGTSVSVNSSSALAGHLLAAA
jgi:hypothetical protein